MTGYDPIREVRFAVVLYGGVSLAVYINGVTQELFSLVRATAPRRRSTIEEPLTELHHDDDELSGTERVYRRLGKVHGADDIAAALEGPVRTRFVVDIVSGSSAGGINGIYLGKALANEQDFASLRDLWVEKGDVGALLNDRTSRTPRAERLPEREPVESLFSGDIMYLELLDALDAMDRPRAGEGPDQAPPSPYVDNLDVWVTTTDLEGQPLALSLADSTIRERRHRHIFHFVFGEAQARAGRRNDFAAELNPVLAFAARATSSFPFAFVPARLVDMARVVRRTGATTDRPDPCDVRWKRWFGPQTERPDFDYENVSFGDGGAMDNKPFGWVIDTLPSRTSSAPVDRRLLYVEPDPGDPGGPQSRAGARPDVIASTIAAVSLGRTENIRDDIERVAKVSDVRERIAAAKDAIDDRYRADAASSEAMRTPTASWMAEDAAAMVARGLPYAAYYRLRMEALTTEFARSLVGLPWHAADTPETTATRELLTRWQAATYDDPFAPTDPAKPTTKQFLRDFDIAFRVRRLAFVAGEADRLHGSFVGDDEVASRARAEAQRVKRLLGAAEEHLRQFVPSVRSNPDPVPPPPATVDTLAPFAAEIAEYLRAVFTQASDRVKDALGGADTDSPEHEVRRCIQEYYDRFGDFDQALFPLQASAGAVGELDDVQVYRVSPQDAISLVDPADHPKVAGSRLGHFGGFIDARWRANDIMWGRLDTVDRLISCFAPPEQQDQLRDEAHDAILREEWYVPGRGGEHRITDPMCTRLDDEGRRWRRTTFVADYQPPPWPATSELVRLSARALRVTSAMLEGVAARPGVKVLHRVVAAVAWLATAIAMVFFPRSAARTPARSLSAVTMVVGVVLTGVGSLLGWDAARATGPVLVAVGLVALVLVLLVRIARRNARQAVVWALALALVGLCGYGAWSLLGDVRDWIDDDDAAPSDVLVRVER